MIPLENPLFLMMHFLGVLSSETQKGGPLGLMIQTEASYLELGGQKILLLPGELFPELAYEGDDGTFNARPEVPNPPLLVRLWVIRKCLFSAWLTMKLAISCRRATFY